MRFPDKLIDKISDGEPFNIEDRETLIYGVDIIFYTIWSTALLLLIGLLLKQFYAAVFIVFGFYALQSHGGGYHAKTHLKCLLTMIFGLLFGLAWVYIGDRTRVLYSIFAVSLLILLLFPLVLHPNKAYIRDESRRLTVISILITAAVSISGLLLFKYFHLPLYVLSVTFFLAAVSRIAGKIVYSYQEAK